MRVRHLILITLALLAGAVTDAEGRTWRVERDGTGDFTTIQPAVDAASPGDVIEIGPGRFDEWHHPEGHPLWFTFVYVTKSLTFIGAGAGETIIGPDDIFNFTYNDFVVGIMAWGSDLELSVRDLTIENVIRQGLNIEMGRLELERCEISRCVSGIFAIVPQGGWIRDCQFLDNGVWGIATGTSVNIFQPSIGLQVENCVFTHNWGANVGVFWSGCREIDVENCTMSGGIAGVVFADGASGSVRNCTISNMINYGIYIRSGGTIVVEDNVIDITDASSAGLAALHSVQSLDMHGNIIMAVDYVLGINARIDAGEVSQNHFLRSSDEAFWVWTATYYPLPEPRIIRLEDNYWGTTDTALLDQYIYDGNDDPDVDIYVDYLPLADGPVPTERTSWGAVKSLFRDADR